MTAPHVSVITPVFRPVFSELDDCLRSVRSPGTEHVLVLDGEANVGNIGRLRRLAKRYGAKLVIKQSQGGISAATNLGVAESSGEFVLFVDQDDFLEKDWHKAFQIAATDSDFVYSDSFISSADGRVVHEQKKPDWSPTRLIFNMYACHFFAVRRNLFEKLGGMRTKFDGSQDHDLALRISRENPRVTHIEIPLYNWRQSAASTASNPENKSWAFDAGAAAAQDHLDALGLDAKVNKIPNYPGTLRAEFAQRSTPISIVVPTAFKRDEAGHCWVENLFLSLAHQFGQVKGDEIILVSGGEPDHGLIAEAASRFGYRITNVVDESQFNFSRRCNIGFEVASNELILLLNDDVEFDNSRSIDQLVGLLGLPNVGLVGGLLVFPDMSIQHGGHQFLEGDAGHAYYESRTHEVGLFDLIVDKEVVGVTGALMMQSKSVWRSVGGFNEALPLNYNDVDYCLKIRSLGFDIIQANSVFAVHHESQTRVAKIEDWELGLLKQRWPDALSKDGFTRS